MNVILSFSPKPQPERSMRLLNLALPFTLFLCITSCPSDDVQIAKISKPLGEKFNKDICGQGIKPGGATDVKFVSTVLLPYYLNKKWLTKDPPKGWEKERDKILAKCHKNTYNYCDADHREKAGDCMKGMAGSSMLKYAAMALSYCPILDKKIENWDISGDKEQALKLFTQYCATKGKKC